MGCECFDDLYNADELYTLPVRIGEPVPDFEFEVFQKRKYEQ